MTPEGNDIYKKKSILVEQYDTIISEHFSLDDLHQFYLGIEKRFFTFLLSPKYHKEKFYLQPNQQNKLEHMINQVKLPSQYHTLKSLKKLKYFKANEIKSLFHYTSRKNFIIIFTNYV
jgi:hypothetical protein